MLEQALRSSGSLIDLLKSKPMNNNTASRAFLRLIGRTILFKLLNRHQEVKITREANFAQLKRQHSEFTRLSLRWLALILLTPYHPAFKRLIIQCQSSIGTQTSPFSTHRTDFPNQLVLLTSVSFK